MTRKAVIGMIRAAALAGAFFLAGGVIPLIGGILMLLAPAPVMVYAVGRTAQPARDYRGTARDRFGNDPRGAVRRPRLFVTFGLATAIVVLHDRAPFSFETISAVGAGRWWQIGRGALAVMAGPRRSSRPARRTCSGDGARAEVLQAARHQDGDSGRNAGDVISLTMRLSPAFAISSAASMVLVNLGVFWRWAGRSGWLTTYSAIFRDGRRRNG